MQHLDVGATQLPAANLETISFEALRSGDEAEAIKLFDACRKDGIFYLDMLGTAPNVLEAVEDVYDLEEAIFRLSEEELMRFDIDRLSSRKLNGFDASMQAQAARWLSNSP